MDNSSVNTLIDEILNDLKSEVGFKGIYLFGSRAGNNWSENSDLDLLIAFDKNLNWREKREIKDKIFDRELQNNYLLDVKIYNINDIEEAQTPFREIIKNNAVFYAIQ